MRRILRGELGAVKVVLADDVGSGLLLLFSLTRDFFNFQLLQAQETLTLIFSLLPVRSPVVVVDPRCTPST